MEAEVFLEVFFRMGNLTMWWWWWVCNWRGEGEGGSRGCVELKGRWRTGDGDGCVLLEGR